MGTEGGASVATLWPPGPPPTPAAQPRTGASLPTETPCSPGVWRGARLLAPATTLHRAGSDARISPPGGGGDTAAPTGICDSSRRRPHPIPDGAPGPQARRVQAEPGRREAPRRLDSASQVSVRPWLCELHFGKLWFACWLPGGGRGERSQGPAASVRPARSAQALGAGTSRTP